MGVANSDAKLYDEEIQALQKAYPEQVRGVAGRSAAWISAPHS